MANLASISSFWLEMSWSRTLPSQETASFPFIVLLPKINLCNPISAIIYLVLDFENQNKNPKSYIQRRRFDFVDWRWGRACSCLALQDRPRFSEKMEITISRRAGLEPPLKPIPRFLPVSRIVLSGRYLGIKIELFGIFLLFFIWRRLRYVRMFLCIWRTVLCVIASGSMYGHLSLPHFLPYYGENENLLLWCVVFNGV